MKYIKVYEICKSSNFFLFRVLWLSIYAFRDKTCTGEVSFHFFKSYLVVQAKSDGGNSRQ